MNKILLEIRYAVAFVLLLLLGFKANAQEQMLLGWQFFNTSAGGGKSTGSEQTYNSSVTQTNIEPSVLTRGSGLTAYALQTGFSSVPAVLTPTYIDAYNGNSYFEFRFKPKANFEANLTAINYKVRLAGNWAASAGQPLNYQWKYSVDNGATFVDAGLANNLTAATNTDGVLQTPVDLTSINNLKNLSSSQEVIFRLYVWGFTKAVGSGTFAIGRSGSATEFPLALYGTTRYLGDITTNYTEAFFTDMSAIARGQSSSVIMDKLISYINNTPAGANIHMSIYMINDQLVMNALKAAETRGVNLHIIVDMSRSDSQITNATSLPWLQTNLANSEIITSINDVSANAINHHKFALFSAVETAEGVFRNVTFQTSHNFTTSDAKKIQDGIMFNNATVYQAFLNNWQTIKNLASSGMAANYIFNTTVDQQNGITLDFFPKIGAGINTSEDNIVETLNSIADVANAKIRIAMSDWTDSRPAIVDKLIQLRQQGALIEVYAKDAAGTQTKAKLGQLQALGAIVRVFNLEEGSDAKFNIHAKMMLIEGTFKGQTNAKVIVTGSHNYTDAALKTNNEVLVILLNSTLFNTYNNYFEGLKTVVPSVQLLAFNLSDIATSVQYSEYPSTTNAGLSLSVLKRGAGLTYSGIAKGFSSSKTATPTVVTANINEAIDRNEYLEFNVKPALGKKVSISEISAVVRRSAGGSFKMQWAYIKNGSAPILIGDVIDLANVTTGQVMDPVVVSNISALQNLTAATEVTLRLYMFAEVARGGAFGFGPSTTEIANVIVLRGDLETIADEKVIMAWSAGALSGETPTFTANNVSAGVTAATLNRGTGLEASSLTSAYSSKTNAAISFNDVSDLASAVVNNSFIQFAFDVKADKKVSLATLNAKLRRSGAGATNYTWAYSLDGLNFTYINQTPTPLTGSISTGVYQTPIDLSQIGALQNIAAGATVTFRVYAWGFTSVTGSFAFGVSESASEDVLLLTGAVVNTLPVTLTKFEAKKTNTVVNLTWSTSSEQHNSHFEILKSTDGKTWEKLTSVKGAGNSNQTINYNYTDKTPFLGNNYYQLKQLDFDGKSSLSKIQVVDFSLKAEAALQANYQSQNLTVFANDFASGNAKLLVYNLNGQKVFEKQVSLQKGANKIQNTLSLTNGLYVLKLSNESVQKTVKFIAAN